MRVHVRDRVFSVLMAYVDFIGPGGLKSRAVRQNRCLNIGYHHASIMC